MSVEETKKHEKAREGDRKKLSPNRGSTQKPSTNQTEWGRESQRETSVGKGNLNLGSNRNAGRAHENESVPDRPMQFTPDQTERDHGKMPVAAEGSIDNRKVGESAAAERHVRSDEGFKIAERRSNSVAANRRETEKAFDARRKKNSSV